MFSRATVAQPFAIVWVCGLAFWEVYIRENGHGVFPTWFANQSSLGESGASSLFSSLAYLQRKTKPRTGCLYMYMSCQNLNGVVGGEHGTYGNNCTSSVETENISTTLTSSTPRSRSKPLKKACVVVGQFHVRLGYEIFKTGCVLTGSDSISTQAIQSSCLLPLSGVRVSPNQSRVFSSGGLFSRRATSEIWVLALFAAFLAGLVRRGGVVFESSWRVSAGGG